MSRSEQPKGGSDARADRPDKPLSGRDRERRLQSQLKQVTVKVPVYRGRTVPMGPFAVWHRAKRWLILAVAVVAGVAGPYAGARYVVSQRDAREAQRLRDVLRTEIEYNLATVAAQIAVLAAVEDGLRAGQASPAPALSASYQSARWAQVETRQDLFPSQAVFRQFADFYRGQTDLDHHYRAYADAKAVWLWASNQAGAPRDDAARLLSRAVADLRGALASQQLTGQTLVLSLRPGKAPRPH